MLRLSRLALLDRQVVRAHRMRPPRNLAHFPRLVTMKVSGVAWILILSPRATTARVRKLFSSATMGPNIPNRMRSFLKCSRRDGSLRTHDRIRDVRPETTKGPPKTIVDELMISRLWRSR